MTTHKLTNIESQKLEITIDEKKLINGGFKNQLTWSVTGMPALLDLRDGQPSGQFVEYKAKIKFDLKNNEIYGARNMKAFILDNTGAVPSDEFKDGDLHTATVSVSDDHEVTISVSNPCGAKDLNLTFTLFSKVPITRAMLTDRDVTTCPENQNYELGDFEEKVMQEAAESVTLISCEDFQSTDTWYMKTHVGRNIFDILNGDANVVEDVALINSNNDSNASNQRGKKIQEKLGESAPSSVIEIVNLIKFCQILQNGSNKPELSSFMIVRTMEKLFTVPVSSSDTLHDLKAKIAAMNANSSFSDSFQWKNLATGKMIDPTKLCADIATGQERTHKFSSPKNIKWVSFE